MQGVVVHASTDGSRLVVDDGSGPPVVAVIEPDAATHSFRRSAFEAEKTGVGAYVGNGVGSRDGAGVGTSVGRGVGAGVVGAGVGAGVVGAGVGQ